MDGDGNAFFCGNFSSGASFWPQILKSMGEGDIFTAKLDSEGNWLWAARAGSIENDRAWDMSLSANGDAYLIGSFRQSCAFGAIQLLSSGDNDIYVAKLSGEGTWDWALKAGGGSIDAGFGIKVTPTDEIYATGSYYTTCHFGSITVSSLGSEDVFVGRVILGETVEHYQLTSFWTELTEQNEVNVSWTTSYESGMLGYSLFRATTSNLNNAELNRLK